MSNFDDFNIDISNLQQYYHIELSGKGSDFKRIPHTMITGEVTMSKEENATPVLNFTLWNDDDAIPGIMTVPTTPSGKVKSMIGAKVRLYGGYAGKSNYKKIFDGVILSSRPQYGDDGRVSISFECRGRNSVLYSKKYNESYPVVSRKPPILKDDQGNESRESTPSDDKSWAVKSTGEVLKLYDIVYNLSLQIPEIKERVIICKFDQDGSEFEPTFDGKVSILHQKDMTDWMFLQYLANEYSCAVWIDDDTDTFYFIPIEKTSEEALTSQSTDNVKDLSFFYHKHSFTKSHNIAPIDKVKPWTPDTYLPIWSINYNYDLGNMQGGVITTSTGPDGKQFATMTMSGDTEGAQPKQYKLKQEMLNTPEGDEFVKNFQLGETSWEDTKKFWQEIPANDLKDNGLNKRKNPPLMTGAANLEFDTFGNIYIKQNKKYYVHNMGFGIDKDSNTDRYSLRCVGYVLKFGEKFTMTVKMKQW